LNKRTFRWAKSWRSAKNSKTLVFSGVYEE
jgi:hypothetical protein